MDLRGFLSLPHRFRWGGAGGDDCMTFCASWVAAQTGIDPAESLRGTYSTKAAAHAVMAAAGGPLAFMAAHLSNVGASCTHEPQDGDIGLVRMLAGEHPDDVAIAEVGAIRFGPLWASISPAGVIARRAEMVAAWRIPQ